MNIGQKINTLYERSGYKNYADWGKAMGIPGDWLNDLKKKTTIKTVDIERLITIAKYNQVTIDWLLADDNNYGIDINTNLADNDIIKMLSEIQKQLQETEVKFNGFAMRQGCKDITSDAIDVLKQIIQNNL